jgi:hypothetical protein
MNRKQFIILLALVVVVGAAGWLVNQHTQDSWRSGGAAIGGKLLPGLAVNDIKQIRLQSGTNELNLAWRDDRWRVRERGDYPANFQQISSLLLKFADLKIAQREDLGPSQFGRFNLLPPGPGTNTGTAVEFKDTAGKTVASVLLGKNHLHQSTDNTPAGGLGDQGWPDGRYVMTGTETKTVAVISDALYQVQTQPEQWLNKDFINIEKPRAVAVEFPEATNSWKLTRASETNDWKLAGLRPDEQPDPAKFAGVTRPFSGTSFNDVGPLNTNTPAGRTVLTVETFDGFTYVARIGAKENNVYPVSLTISASLAGERTPGKDEKAENKVKLDQEFKTQQKALADKLAKEKQCEPWVYQVPAYGLDEVLKPRAELLLVQTNAVAVK